MKNSVWNEYRNGVAWMQAREELLKQSIATAPAAEPFNSLKPGETWLCLWDRHFNPIGLSACEECGMPRTR